MPSPIDFAGRALRGALGGAVTGGGIGAIGGLIAPASGGKDRLKHVGQGALSGGLMGGAFGGMVGGVPGGAPASAQQQGTSGSAGARSRERAQEEANATRLRARAQRKAQDPASVEWLRGVSTKADAKKAYRAQVQNNHPDLARTTEERVVREESLKKINDVWDRVKDHSGWAKFAFVQGLKDACKKYRVDLRR